MIQKVWRGHHWRSELKARHSAATTIQAVERGAQARRKHKAKHSAATTVERIWRGCSCRLLLAKRHYATTIIQTAARGRLARVSFRAKIAHVRRVQKVWRGRAERRMIAEMHAAAARMQAIQRGRHERKMAIVKRMAAGTIEMRLKQWIMRKKQKFAATRIQIAWRWYLLKLEMRRKRAAILIQKMWRAKVVRSVFAGLRAAATTIQAHWRGYLARKFRKASSAARIVQARYRGRLSRRWFEDWGAIQRISRAGNDAFAAKQFEEAVHDYTTVIKLEKGENAATFSRRAAALTALGMYEQAVADCDRTLKRTYGTPKAREALRRKGTALYAQGKFVEAEGAYNAALTIDPNDEEAIQLLARLTTVLELRKRARGERSSKLPRSALLLERAKLLSQQMELAHGDSHQIRRPVPMLAPVERMQRGARFHAQLRGQVFDDKVDFQVEIADNGVYTIAKRPKSRGGSPERSRADSPEPEPLRLPPIVTPVC